MSLDMRSLIKKSKKHLIWQDELGDDFLLTKWCEIYRFSEEVLGLYIFSHPKAFLGDKNRTFFDFMETDDLLRAKAYVKDLPYILAMGATFRQRPYLNGKFINNLEDLLGHKIIAYRPTLETAA